MPDRVYAKLGKPFYLTALKGCRGIVFTEMPDRVYAKLGKPFYLTALKGCRGIVFTHGVWMGGQVAGRCMSETIRCTKLMHGRDIG